MAAQLHRRTLEAVGGQPHQMLADRNRAGETHFADHRRGQQVPAHNIRHTIDQLHHPIGQSGIDQAAHQRTGAAGGLLGRLGNHRAACRQRRSQLLGHQINRKVPRAERCHRPDRLLDHNAALTRRSHQHPAVNPLGLFGAPFEQLGAASHLTARFGNRLALFAG